MDGLNWGSVRNVQVDYFILLFRFDGFGGRSGVITSRTCAITCDNDKKSQVEIFFGQVRISRCDR